ncbi:NUDIX domain-containing protein [Pseudarthrobacter sp. O4]|uniref:NUDIX domain-containing protein n=1 Tax=Pseudarthrobacter sp. O4 TaxID=3418417 RepID=UPI003CFA687C
MTHRVVVGALVGPLGVLLCHRRPSVRWYAGKWDFPGGHVENGETAGDALTRELREEIAVIVASPSGDPDFIIRENEDSPDGLALSGWVLTEWSGNPANIAAEEHDEVKWFAPSDALQLELAHDAYAEVLRRIGA